MILNMKKTNITAISLIILFVTIISFAAIWWTTSEYFQDEPENEMFHSFCEEESDMQSFENNEEQIKELDAEYTVTLKRYIYDGISAYAAFSVKCKDGSKQDLEQFGLSDLNSSENYYFANFTQKNQDEKKTEKQNEKLIFIHSTLLNCQSAEDNIAENNNLYLIDNTDNSRRLSFPLEISTDYFEAKGESFTVRVSPIQVFFMNKKKNTIHDITVVYEDGDREELLKNGSILGEVLGDSETKINEDGIVMFYSIRESIDFDKIKEVEAVLSTGEKVVLQRVKKILSGCTK